MRYRSHIAPSVFGMLALSVLPQGVFAQDQLPSSAPIPQLRAYAPAQGSGIITGSLAKDPFRLLERGAASEGDRMAVLKAGLDALGEDDIARAIELGQAMPEDSLDSNILLWAIATSGSARVPSTEIARAGHRLTDWPGASNLRAASERALYRENPGYRVILKAFGNTRPETAEGTVLLARARLAAGDTEIARRHIERMWRSQRMDALLENRIIDEFAELISKDAHWHRMEQMLHFERISSAERVAGLAGGKELTRAWAAATRNEANAESLLEAVPQEQRSAGYLFAKSRYLRRAGDYREAAKTMLSAPTNGSELIDPDSWWIERRVLSREMLDLDEPELAYEIAANHAAKSPVRVADAEFHAGWYALRSLEDPAGAAKHFAKIADIAEGPISLARAYYWLGRTADEGGPGDAQSYYEQSAQYGTSFYGQLAAAKLERDTLMAIVPEASRSDRLSFERREAVQAIRRLEEAGHAHRARPLYRDLARQIDNAGELSLLAAMALEREDHMLALLVGKWAVAQGRDVGALSHPVGAIPESADISGAGEALAYAIARQESEFNTNARSGAGALGLLQLLPGTAREMARRNGVSYSQSRLTSDPGYNATLGAAYLQEQLDRFAGSYILTFAGYNAGPSRARQWVERYGDPRGKPIEEVVDWLERIPFHETRAYVQRVMENYQVYKMQLSGKVDVLTDLVSGR